MTSLRAHAHRNLPLVVIGLDGNGIRRAKPEDVPHLPHLFR
jgi:hypothetical protein